MKYLVLKKRPIDAGNIFLEKAGAGGSDDAFPFPFEAHAMDLRDQDVTDLRRDPTTEDVIPSIPFTLIKPVEYASAAPARAEEMWGLDAVGATASPHNGAGVTVAVLDTGIDRTHAAFSGLTFDAEDLRDFTVNEQGVAGSAPDAHGHGTHVAGTIFGRPVNGKRIGVAPGVTKVLIGKVLGPAGGSTEAICSAIEWALSRRADVISMSLGIDFPGVVQRMIDSGIFGL